jgi:hemoglobin
MSVQTGRELSAFERVGGAPAVKAVVDRFYEQVLADADLARYFAPLDGAGMAQLKRHQVAMISQVLDGPREYTGRELAEAHRPLNISALHYRRVAHLLVGTLWQFDVPEDIIFYVGGVLTDLQDVIATKDGDAAAGEAR